MHKSIRKLFMIAARTCCPATWICALLLLAVCGCGGDGRLAVEGNVTLDGRPLERGNIKFCPVAGTKGPTAGADVIDGKYTVPCEAGLFAGKFRVEVTVGGATGRKVVGLSGALVDEYAQILPARYNSRSELQAEVTAVGPNSFDFALTSDKMTAAPRRSTP